MSGDNSEIQVKASRIVKKKFWIPFLVLVLLLGAYLSPKVFSKSESSVKPISIYEPKGQLVIPAQFESPSYFHNGMSDYSTKNSDAPLFSGGGNTGKPLSFNFTDDRYGLISADGKISPPLFKLIGEFENGLAPAESEDEQYGAIDTNGKWKITPKYYWLGNFRNGLAPFSLTEKSKYGYLNLKGEVVIPPKWDGANDFYEQRAMVCNNFKDGISLNCGFINLDGKLVTKLEYSSFTSHPFSEGLAMVCKGLEEQMRCGYIDLNGKVVEPIDTRPTQNKFGTWMPYLNDFIGGYAIYGGRWHDGIQKWGLVNRKFKTQIDSIFTEELSKYSSEPWGFDAGVQWQTLGRTKDNPGKSAAMDFNGNVLFYSNYEAIEEFVNGISAVRVAGKWGFINQKNEMVVKPQFDEVRDYSEGFAAVRINGLWGYIN